MPLSLEIVTPKGRALSLTVEEVNVPAFDGEFGVLPGHLATLAAARAGILSYREGNEWKRCAVGHGFIEVSPPPDTKVTVLTGEYVVRDQVDPVVVRTELKDVQAEIAKAEAAQEAPQLKALIERENWLAAELELYGDPPPPTMRPYEEYGPSGIDETAGAAPSTPTPPG